jgi:hypothetical protein
MARWAWMILIAVLVWMATDIIGYFYIMSQVGDQLVAPPHDWHSEYRNGQ